MPKAWPRSLERSAARRTRKDLRTRHGEEIAMMPNGYDCFPHVLSTHGRRYLPSLCHAKYYVAPPLHYGRLSRYCLSPLDQVIRRSLRHVIISILVRNDVHPSFSGNRSLPHLGLCFTQLQRYPRLSHRPGVPPTPLSPI
jgi:hypothetical protein